MHSRVFPGRKAWLYSAKVAPTADKFAERYKGMRSDSTAIQYRQGARSFDKYLKTKGRTVINLDNGDIDGFVRWLSKAKKKPNTIQNYSKIARNYVKWVAELGVSVPEMLPAMLPSVEKNRMSILPEKLIPAYNAACMNHLKEPFRTALLLLPMSGLRVSEMCCLENKDAETSPPTPGAPFGAAQLHVLGKGNKYRNVPVLAEGIIILARYEEIVRPTLKRSRWLFPSSQRADGHIDRHQITKRMAKVKEKMGISKLHPHLLRHTYGTILNEAGIDGFDLASIMGHSDVKVTSIYVHPVESRLLADVSQLSYRNRKKSK